MRVSRISSLNPQAKAGKRRDMLKLIARCYGYGSVDDMLEDSQLMLDCVVPGICTECGCVEDSCEPDAERNWCSDCNKKAVVAVTVLAGVL